MLTLGICSAMGGWFSSDEPVTLGSGLLVEVLVPNVHIVDYVAPKCSLHPLLFHHNSEGPLVSTYLPSQGSNSQARQKAQPSLNP